MFQLQLNFVYHKFTGNDRHSVKKVGVLGMKKIKPALNN